MNDSFLGLPFKVPQTTWLKQQKFIVLQFWWLEVHDEGVSRATLALKALGKAVSQASLPASATSLAGGSITFISAWGFSLCVCAQMSPFYKDDSHIRSGAHPIPV